ncbi:hypothetical protein P153DRAFT_367909 [Dothidotthia symphoricarpi CBS 119687]|uniref:Uncharacterized protein n=1 Tax=Dothidotthia symphoricarpi CBS 119687 TaxID=1392245 RepID=A0A6A6AA79_9PLEO|nr:uncharacterized protein P153DRAFT_367909 [Dothidotthia symphoricarpi CBS 119687]KAF2127994.1 hypothetical protein P153DRAFT_367909 [Dothidotthia symphoricarpi CBS 119687]
MRSTSTTESTLRIRLHTSAPHHFGSQHSPQLCGRLLLPILWSAISTNFTPMPCSVGNGRRSWKTIRYSACLSSKPLHQ